MCVCVCIAVLWLNACTDEVSFWSDEDKAKCGSSLKRYTLHHFSDYLSVGPGS